MIQSKKGFTLIELLIVIAIIGILASALLVSLGGARQTARDAKRIADLRNVQNGLELYFNANGFYPPSSTWGVLESTLVAANIGINNIPDDPTYAYAANGTSQVYLLKAVLEKANAAFNDDVDDNSNVITNAFGGTSPFPCDDATLNYCISN
jgi:prepilin-type N-terminal cleavage/methylation domain-containing protein